MICCSFRHAAVHLFDIYSMYPTNNWLWSSLPKAEAKIVLILSYFPERKCRESFPFPVPWCLQQAGVRESGRQGSWIGNSTKIPFPYPQLHHALSELVLRDGPCRLWHLYIFRAPATTLSLVSICLPPPVTPFSSALLLFLVEINKNFLDFVMLIQGATRDREQLAFNNIATAFNSRRQLESHF